jgi:hypothetical protein
MHACKIKITQFAISIPFEVRGYLAIVGRWWLRPVLVQLYHNFDMRIVNVVLDRSHNWCSSFIISSIYVRTMAN